MRICWKTLALQLNLLSCTFTTASILSESTGIDRRYERDVQQAFDENTASLKQQGLCRQYLSLGHTTESTSTCENKCGDMVKKAEETGKVTSVGCAGLGGLPSYTDPKGNDYEIGRCICDPPLVDEIFNEVLIALPAIGDIGCSILFGAFDLILEVGAAAIPGVGEMTVGMKAGVQAAKTLAENGQDASSFLQWFASPCGHSKYTDQIDKIFNPLSNIPDSTLPGLGCKGKKCPGKKDSTKSKDNSPDPKTTKKQDQPSTKKEDHPSTTQNSHPSQTAQTKTSSARPSLSASDLSESTTRPPATATRRFSTTTKFQTTSTGNRNSSALWSLTLSTTATSTQSSSSPTKVCRRTKSKRSVKELKMSLWMGRTYKGFVKADQAMMEPCEVEAYAEKGYELIENRFSHGTTLVSALFVPNIGVFVGSKPRGKNSEDDEGVAKALEEETKKEFPMLSQYMSERKNANKGLPSIAYYHAEDNVLLDGGAKYRDVMGVDGWNENGFAFADFPVGTRIATYGRYFAADNAVGIKPPCRSGKLAEFSCTAMLAQFDVQYSVPPK